MGIGYVRDMIKRNLVRKFPSYVRLSWAAFSPAFSPSCQPHRHVIVGKCNRSGTREFRFEKTIGRKTLRFFRVSVSAGAGLDLPKLSTKRAQDCSESSVSHKNRKKTVSLGALLEDEVGKMRKRLYYSSSINLVPYSTLWLAHET